MIRLGERLLGSWVECPVWETSYVKGRIERLQRGNHRGVVVHVALDPKADTEHRFVLLIMDKDGELHAHPHHNVQVL